MKDLQIVNESNTLVVDSKQVKETAIQWLTSTGNLQKFTESEKNQFIDMCVTFGLNPIKREVYGIKYKGKNGFPDTFQIVIGYEVYLKRAERTGKLDGFNVECKKMGDEIIATCTIYRKDWTHPFIHSVLLSEYNQKNKMWNEKPVTMIKKVATEQAFRLCFPDEMGGLPYGEEELPSENVSNTTPIEKDITPSKSSEETPKTEEKKSAITKTQMEHFAQIMNEVLADGSPVFSVVEKDSYRAMLRDGLYEDAEKQASEILEQRKATQTPSAQEIEQELN